MSIKIFKKKTKKPTFIFVLILVKRKFNYMCKIEEKKTLKIISNEIKKKEKCNHLKKVKISLIAY